MKENDIVRQLNNDSMYNDYYKELEVIHKDAWMNNAYVDPWVAEAILGEDVEKYDTKYGGYYVNIVEAFDKVWCFIQSYGDGVTTVHINEDGEVYGSGQGLPSPELDDGRYYAGDEITGMGSVEPFTSKQSWLWNSVQVDCKQKLLCIGEASFKGFVELRKDYLIEQAEKA